MDFVYQFAFACIAIGGIGILIMYIYSKAKGEDLLCPWISKMERGDPVVAVEVVGFSVQNVMKIATSKGYKLLNAYSMSGGIDVGYVVNSYVFMPPQREARYMLTFSKV